MSTDIDDAVLRKIEMLSDYDRLRYVRRCMTDIMRKITNEKKSVDLVNYDQRIEQILELVVAVKADIVEKMDVLRPTFTKYRVTVIHTNYFPNLHRWCRDHCRHINNPFGINELDRYLMIDEIPIVIDPKNRVIILPNDRQAVLKSLHGHAGIESVTSYIPSEHQLRFLIEHTGVPKKMCPDVTISMFKGESVKIKKWLGTDCKKVGETYPTNTGHKFYLLGMTPIAVYIRKSQYRIFVLVKDEQHIKERIREFSRITNTISVKATKNQSKFFRGYIDEGIKVRPRNEAIAKQLETTVLPMKTKDDEPWKTMTWANSTN